MSEEGGAPAISLFAVLLKWGDNAGCRNTDKLPSHPTQPKSVVCAVGEVDGEGIYEALAGQKIADKYL